MTDREFEGPDGRRWRVRERSEARREDGDDRLTLEFDTPGERRVLTCARSEWEGARSDLVALLARSLPGGASRGLGTPEEPPAAPPPPPDGMAW